MDENFNINKNNQQDTQQYTQQSQQPDYTQQYNQQPQQVDYTQQYNQQPQQYNQPYYNQQYPTYIETENGKQGFAIASMIIGICSIVFSCCVPYITFFSSIPGLILGIISLKKNENGKGMAIAGIITSGCALIFSLLLAIFYIAIWVNEDYSGLYSPYFNYDYNFDY